MCFGTSYNDNTTQIDSLRKKEADSLFKLARHLVLVERNYKESKRLFIKTDSLYLALKIYKKVIASKVNTTFCLQRLWQPPEIYKVPIEQAFEYEKFLDPNHFDLARLYDHYSRYKYRVQEYEDAKHYVVKALKIFNDPYHDDAPNVKLERYNNLLNLASIEKALYNYDKAEELYLKGLELSKEFPGETITVYANLINFYSVSRKHEKLDQLLQKEEVKNYDKEKTPLYSVFGIETTKASYYLDIKNHDLALKTLLDFQKFVSTSNYDKHVSESFIKRRLSHIYFDKGDYEKVIEILNSISDNDDIKVTDKSFKSERLKLLAQSYFNIGKIEASKEAINNAIALNFDEHNITKVFHEKIILENTKTKNLALIQALTIKGDISKQIYDTTNAEDYLVTALDSYQNVHELIKIIGSLSDEDKFISNDEFKSFYESLLDIYHLNWKKTKDSKLFYKALSVCDESKNVTILSEIKSIKQSQLQKSIPKEILEQEEELLKVLDSVQSLPYIDDSLKTKKVKDSIEHVFKTFQNQLKTLAPNYYDVKYGNGKPIKQHIKTKFKDDNIIEFFYGNDAIYIFNVNDETLQFDKIVLTDHLKEQINTVIKSLQNRDSKTFKKSSSLIYNSLFKNYIEINKKNKVILDGELHLLPIESLWVPSNDRPHFLIEDINVIRLNSITQNFISQIGQDNTLLFAPFATQEGFDKAKLSGSAYEVNRINEILKGEIYLDEQANKKEFLERATNSSLIHLATHSSINREAPLSSKIYFYDNSNLEPSQKYLKLEELYAMKLNSNLVTLSACETGIGKEVKGKGVISLSNAFAYSGVKSTVMSLWKVPDQETSTLMISFYENLNKGQDKDDALRNAKLHYIKSIDDEVLKHPYYWAGFVISGDSSPLQNQTPFYYYIIALSFLVILILSIKRFKSRY